MISSRSRHITRLLATALATVLALSAAIAAWAAQPGATASPVAPAAPFPDPPNLGEIQSIAPLDEAAMAMLHRNGFVVMENVTRSSLAKAYPKDPDGLVFVTTDAMLCAWFEIHRAVLMDAERRAFYPSLQALVPQLARAAVHLRATEHPGPPLDSAIVSLSVAERLLCETDKAPSDLAGRVSGQVGKIMAHSEVAYYPGEDYTLYTVRGYYAESPLLGRYFRGSLWLTRDLMAIDPVPGSDPDSGLRRAVVMAAIVRSAPDARKKLRDLNAARAALVGAPNAVSVEQAIQAINRILGDNWTLAGALRPAALTSLRKELQKDTYPHCPVHTRITIAEIPFPHTVEEVLPDIAIPDSILFQETMAPAIEDRDLPTGLEVGAALGSDAASAQISATDPRAIAVLAAVRRHPGLVAPGDHSVYADWLRVLATLHKRDDRAPEFMHTSAWSYEKLNTSLASWAQLRHNTILYVAPPGATAGIDTRPPPPALVEPNPAFYQGLGDLSAHTRIALHDLGGLSAQGASMLNGLEDWCRLFAGDSRAELTGGLDESAAGAIKGFGEWVENLGLESGPVVVDVANGGLGSVLHAAVGNLNPIIVIPDRSRPVAYVGWVMSYYEFTRQGNDRLTDARWKETLASDYLRPDRSGWAREFMSIAGGQAWQSRAPLREAESLLLEGKAEEGLALLRKTVDQNRTSSLATEAQCRVARYYFERKDDARAWEELLRTRKLPRCDASGQIGQMMEVVSWRKRSPQRTRWLAPFENGPGKAEAVVKALRPLPVSPNRAARERELALALIASDSRGRVPGSLFARAAAACRTPYIREALTYQSLRSPRGWRSESQSSDADEGLDSFFEASLRFGRSSTSPALKANVLSDAVEAGYLNDDPGKAGALLAPYLKREVVLNDRSQATRLLCETVFNGGDFLSEDAEAPHQALHLLLPDAAEKALLSGHPRQAWALIRISPADVGGHAKEFLDAFQSDGWTVVEKFTALLAARQDSAGDPAALKLIAARFNRVQVLFPLSKLSPYSLAQAASCLKAAGDTAGAEKIRDILARGYPDSPPGKIARAEIAIASGDLDAALKIIPADPSYARMRFMRGSGMEGDPSEAPPYAMPGHWNASEVGGRLAQWQATRNAAAPVLQAAHQEKLLASIRAADLPADVAQRIAAVEPASAAAIYVAMAGCEADLGGEAQAFRHVMDDFPTAPGVDDLLKNHRVGEADAPWVAALVNRGATYPRADWAVTTLEQLCSSTQDYGEDALMERERLAERVGKTYPGTRAAGICAVLLAERQAKQEFPEKALVEASDAIPLVANMPAFRQRAELVRSRARKELWSRQQPDWLPAWSASCDLSGARFPGHDLPLMAPTVLAGALIVPWAAADKWPGAAAIDEDTGAVRWVSPIGPVVNAAIDGAGHIVCGTASSSVVALDPATGRTVYERVLDINREWATWAAPAGPMTVVVSACGLVAGIRASTGEVAWKQEWDCLDGALVIAGDLAIVTLKTGEIRAVRVATGELAWSRAIPPDKFGRLGLRGLPVLAGRNAIILDGHDLLALDAATGAVRAPGPPHRLWDRNWMIVDPSGMPPGTLLVGLPGDEIGQWASETTRMFAPSGSIVYQTNSEGVVRALDTATSAHLDWYPTEDEINNCVLGIGKHVYLFTQSGALTALPLVPEPPDL